MKKLLLVSSLLFFVFTVTAQQHIQKSKLTVEFNPNIATYSIVERLMAAKDGRFFYIDGKADDSYLPMVHLAFTKMQQFDNKKILQQFGEYIQITGLQQDLTYHALLRANTFPAKGFKYSFDGLKTDSVKLAAVKKFTEQLRLFFIERKLEQFFKTNKRFINGAINEVRKNIPPGYELKLEKYYGEEISGYKFYVNPFDDIPYDTTFWHGNGPKIKTPQGWIANMISSAYLPLAKENNINQYNHFGFDHPATVNLLVTHEYGHSFVNPLLEPFEKQINESADLKYAGLNEAMENQAYGYWPTCITEHIVRLGEIRIAATNGNKPLADSLRKLHTVTYSFALLPFFEKKIIEYENNRDKYPSLKDFIPQLLTVLKSITADDVRKQMGLTTEKFTVTINLKVPAGSGDVYITGNQMQMGNWDPKKVKLNYVSEDSRSITFTSYADLRFKFTKGSWETEGNVTNHEKGKDISQLLTKNDTLNFEITGWNQ